jgi:hypothetical protein
MRPTPRTPRRAAPRQQRLGEGALHAGLELDEFLEIGPLADDLAYAAGQLLRRGLL